jgi:predicted acylesterase/phospholipase RssA
MTKFFLAFIFLLLPLRILAQSPPSDAPRASLPCKINVQGRPSVGLALEGGVAYGLAHVGVLEWLEENHIPVDCVAGTSMGGLIGGLYAMGYTLHPRKGDLDMNQFFDGLDRDWDAIFYDQVDYANLSFTRKEDRRTFPSALEFRFNRGIHLPEGVNPGHRVGLIFDRLAWPFYGLPSFDDLAVPFRCVATDINANKSDVLGRDVFFDRVGAEGTLSEALRSTMSLPGYFYPVVQQVRTKEGALVEKRYVDGGLLRNLPIEELVEMGADIVISVHLDVARASSGSDPSFLDVVSDSISLITSTNEQASLNSLKENHIRLTIHLGAFKSTDFNKWKKIRAQGAADAAASFAAWAKAHPESFKQEDGKAWLFGIELSEEAYSRYRDELSLRVNKYRQASASPAYVTISANKPLAAPKPALQKKPLPAGTLPLIQEEKSAAQDASPTNNRGQAQVLDADLAEQIRRNLSCQESKQAREEGPEGRPIYQCPKYVPAAFTSPAPLEKQLNRMVGTGRFLRLGYHVQQDEKKRTYLAITANKKDTSPIVLQPVFAVDGSDFENPIFVLGARFIAFDVGATGSEWRGEALLGSRYGLSTEYYQPLFGVTSRWFVASRAMAESSPFNIYHQETQLAHYQLRTVSGGLDVGYNFVRNAQLRLGYEGGGTKLSRILGDNIFPFSSERVGTTSVKFSLDLLKFNLRKLEAPVVPRDGLSFTSAFQWHDSWLGATEHFPTVAGDLGLFKSVNKSRSGSLYLKADGGSTLGYTNSGLPSFSLGSPFRLAAYGTNELLTNQYWHASAGYVHQVYPFESLGGAIYLTGSFEVAKAYGIAGAPSLPRDGTAGVILDSVVGPLFVGGSLGDGGHKKFFFYLGRLF